MASSLFTLTEWGPFVCYAYATIEAITERDPALTPLRREHYPALQCPEDISLYSSTDEKVVSASANSLVFNPRLLEIDQDACGFICKHQIFHIRCSSRSVSNSLAMATSAVSGFAATYFHSFLLSLAPLFVANMTHRFATYLFEKNAAHFAFNHATDAEVKGFERFIKSYQEVCREFTANHPRLATRALEMALGQTYNALLACSQLLDEEMKSRHLEGQSISETLKGFHLSNIQRSVKSLSVTIIQ